MEKEIKIGDKIAQIIFEFYNKAEWELVDDLPQTQRGAGGFGSSDKKGKPLTEIFTEEQIKFDSQKTEPTPSILQTYLKTGGVHVSIPYSEQIKARSQQ